MTLSRRALLFGSAAAVGELVLPKPKAWWFLGLGRRVDVFNIEELRLCIKVLENNRIPVDREGFITVFLPPPIWIPNPGKTV